MSGWGTDPGATGAEVGAGLDTGALLGGVASAAGMTASGVGTEFPPTRTVSYTHLANSFWIVFLTVLSDTSI